MKNLVNLAILGVFTTAITIGLIDMPEDTTLNVPPIIEQVLPFEPLEDLENTEKDGILENDDVNESEIFSYMHGVFVATVYNLDFPSTANLSESKLREEIDYIVNTSFENGITDLFFQVRPCADAFYDSEIFNTSVYLTGNQDKEPHFDVLQYYIDKCHEKGMKLHAWINPYRITKDKTDVLSDNHIAKTNPHLTVLHTDGNLYFDPGLQDARQLILDGIEEIIVNYDVDGIHFDDYFYPSTKFNDDESYSLYGNGRSLDDFRRDSVTSLISQTFDLVNNIKPDVLFGVSPIGIWANLSDTPDGSDTNGNGSYIVQYADTKKWVEMEIIDYIAPQIYWNIGFENAEYITLVDWWSDVCKDYNVDLYICQANYKETSGVFTEGEIKRQLEYNMTKDNIKGSIYFRFEHIS